MHKRIRTLLSALAFAGFVLAFTPGTTEAWGGPIRSNIGGCEFSRRSVNGDPAVAYTQEHTSSCGAPQVRFRTSAGGVGSFYSGGSAPAVYAYWSQPHSMVGAQHKSCTTCRILTT